jgi:hypothetical protein
MHNNINNKIAIMLVFRIVIALLFSNLFVLIYVKTLNKTTPIKIGVTVRIPNFFLAFIAQEKEILKKK